MTEKQRIMIERVNNEQNKNNRFYNITMQEIDEMIKEEEKKMYNYMEEMKNAIKDEIKESYPVCDFANREEMEEQLNEELWISDSVTGNASGSYTCNTWKAKEYVLEDGIQYLSDMAREFGVDMSEMGEHFVNEDWEWFDVSIRCYLLSTAISEVLDEMEENKEFDKGNH